VEAQRSDRQQRGLARTVGPEHHPALAWTDDEVDAVEEVSTVSGEPDLLEPEGGCHRLLTAR